MRSHCRVACRAFTLAELMIVLIILGVVLGVVLPSLSATTRSAQRAATTTLMSGIGAAATSFSTDNQGRNPGYFTAQQMGASENETQGFAGLMNIMLDLMPGITTKPAAVDQQVLAVGPGAAGDAGSQVNVDLTQLGAAATNDAATSTRSYYRPDPKYFYSTVDPAQLSNAGALVNGRQVSANDNHYVLPTLHDAFGQPILGWQQDDRTAAVFAADNSGSLSGSASAQGSQTARFYWASNACFLRATSLGKKLLPQNTGSLIGRSQDDLVRIGSLSGLLGNPAFPGTGSTLARARGPLVFHSAGANGVYVGAEERGAIIARGTGSNPTPLLLIPGVDPFKSGDFDDIVLGSGN